MPVIATVDLASAVVASRKRPMLCCPSVSWTKRMVMVEFSGTSIGESKRNIARQVSLRVGPSTAQPRPVLPWTVLEMSQSFWE